MHFLFKSQKCISEETYISSNEGSDQFQTQQGVSRLSTPAHHQQGATDFRTRNKEDPPP
jgi:hypothetical protein